MVGQCSCRAYFPPNALKEPTARELLDTLSDKDGPPYIEDATLILSARVKKVLALHRREDDIAEAVSFCADCNSDWPCPTVRILNGEAE